MGFCCKFPGRTGISHCRPVVKWSEFLGTDPEILGSVPGTTRFSDDWKLKLKLKLSCYRRSVSQACFGVELPSGTHDQIFFFCLTVASFLMLGTLSDKKMSLLFTRTIASGSCQSCHSLVQVPQNSVLVSGTYLGPATKFSLSLNIFR
jgi:hypothetical protein